MTNESLPWIDTDTAAAETRKFIKFDVRPNGRTTVNSTTDYRGEPKPLSVMYDDLSDYQKDIVSDIFGMKERRMKQELKDYILDRLIALRIIESPCIDENTCARVDELLLLLVELVDDAGE